MHLIGIREETEGRRQLQAAREGQDTDPQSLGWRKGTGDAEGALADALIVNFGREWAFVFLCVWHKEVPGAAWGLSGGCHRPGDGFSQEAGIPGSIGGLCEEDMGEGPRHPVRSVWRLHGSGKGDRRQAALVLVTFPAG